MIHNHFWHISISLSLIMYIFYVMAFFPPHYFWPSLLSSGNGVCDCYIVPWQHVFLSRSCFRRLGRWQVSACCATCATKRKWTALVFVWHWFTMVSLLILIILGNQALQGQASRKISYDGFSGRLFSLSKQKVFYKFGNTNGKLY